MASEVIPRPAQWPADPLAIEVQSWSAPEGDMTTLIRHPAEPFLAEAAIDDFAALAAAAYRYLLAASQLGLCVPPPWLEALAPHADRTDDFTFGWLPLEDHEDEAEAPVPGSRVVDDERDGLPVNRTMILLAGESEDGRPLGSEVGVRVVVQASATGAEAEVRITGASSVVPHHLLPPDGLAGLLQVAREQLPRLLRETRAAIAEATGSRPEALHIRGVRPVRRHTDKPPPKEAMFQVRARTLIAPSAGAIPAPYEVVAKMTRTDDGRPARVDRIRTSLLSANGCAPAVPARGRDFPGDPAAHAGPALWRARRPTRTDAALDKELEPDTLPVALEIDGRFKVVQTWFVPGDHPPDVKSVSQAAQPATRSNDFTAISAFRNVRALFERFDRYGIPLPAYFFGARLPLDVHYRSGVRPGPGKDGQTVNGRVSAISWHDVPAPHARHAARRPRLAMHLALAELPVRRRRRWDKTQPSHAEPFGFAADPRWMWHEASHVLLMATLGELEFRFAHSMGDGLAAIVTDPVSRLAADPIWRGATYPFVYAPRRHDRCVCGGWGWAGLIGRDLRQAPAINRVNPKGYLTEQILSTTLFRLYRCLGGDTVVALGADPDPVARRRASDYAVYLIMEAVRLLGDPLILPATQAFQFAAALMDADERTVTCPVEGGPWVGGTADKVVRWAFEAQGMYAAPGDVDAPGQAPLVDIYIADDRAQVERFPATTVSYGPGSYAPTSLDWAGLAGGGGGAAPAWFSTAAMVVADGALSVMVGNRGGATATGVHVRVWTRSWPGGQLAPVWDRSVWSLLATVDAGDIAGHSTVTVVGIDLPAAANRVLVLAEAFCAADRANIDPAAKLAPSAHPVPLPELVPLDNNLGVIVV